MQYIIEHQLLEHFIYAGKANFTIEDNEFDTKLVVYVKQNRSIPGMYWVRSNEQFLGTIFQKRFTVKPATKEKPNVNGPFFLKFFTLVLMNRLPDTIKVYHHGICGRCRRKLTDPGSIITGIGPECVKKLASST